ncbi:MAG: EamA family transporter RarD [Acidimicrobiia bacterium]|nr:EamA family transporter RarD [Acidimicrobiia bacterium]
MVRYRNSGVLTGALAYILWGLLTIFWHALSGINAFGLIAWRVVMSVLMLGIALTIVHRWNDLRPVFSNRRTLAGVLLAGTMLGINWTTYVYCVTHDRVVDTALGYLLAPIGIVLAGVVVLHEPFRRVQGAALALCGVAVVVLAIGYGSPPTLALVMATTWTCYGLAKKLVPLPALEGLAAETILIVPAAIAFLVFMQLFGTPSLTNATGPQIVLVALTGVVTTVPLLLFASAARRVPLSTLGWLQFFVPTINLALGVWLYNESMPAWRLAGFALVWAAVALITLDGLRMMRKPRSTSDSYPVPEPAPVPLEG